MATGSLVEVLVGAGLTDLAAGPAGKVRDLLSLLSVPIQRQNFGVTVQCQVPPAMASAVKVTDSVMVPPAWTVRVMSGLAGPSPSWCAVTT